MNTGDADHLSLSDLSVSDDTPVGDLGDELQEGNPLWAKEAAWRLGTDRTTADVFWEHAVKPLKDVPTAATPEAKVLDYAGNVTTVLGLENLSRLLLKSAKLEVSAEDGDGDIPKSATCAKSSHRSTEALSLTAKTLRLIERRFCPCEHEKGCGCQCAELQDDRWRKNIWPGCRAEDRSEEELSSNMRISTPLTRFVRRTRGWKSFERDYS